MNRRHSTSTGNPSGFKRKFLFSFTVFLSILGAGTLGFRLLDGGRHSLVDYLYMTVITVTTVGYGEVVDLSGNPAGRVFAMALIFSGMGVILYFLSNITAFLIEGDLNEIFWRKKMEKTVSAMDKHYIVCGAGTIGLHILEELHLTKRPTVVIDISHERIENIKREFEGAGFIVGDATDNDVLIAAGIERAMGLIAATSNDKDNLVITITARQMRPDLRVVARCNEFKNTEKLKSAGADSVVSSNFIGGLRMASEMVRPAVVSFLDMMLRERDSALRIEEVLVRGGSSLADSKASDIREKVLLLAIQRTDGSYEFNPHGQARLSEGDKVIFMGEPEDRLRLEGRA